MEAKHFIGLLNFSRRFDKRECLVAIFLSGSRLDAAGDVDTSADTQDTIRLVDADEAADSSGQTAIVDANSDSTDAATAQTAESTGLGATLQRVLGDRNTLLGAGAGLALLGLLGAWLMRRKKPAVAATVGSDARVEPEFAGSDTNTDTKVADKQARTASATATAAAPAAAVAAERTRAPESMDETLVQDDTVSEADV